MSDRILVVCGSRALADTPTAEAWARAQIVDYARHAWWGKPPTLIVTGDARGADAYALSYAHAQGVPCERWCLNGYREWTHHGGGSATRWWPEGAPQLPPKRWPLERNRRMVADVGTRALAGASVRVLGLSAPWSLSRGTGHTIVRAQGAGLPVNPLVCPAELGPGVRDADR